MALVLQQYSLYPRYTVAREPGIPAEIAVSAALKPAEIKERVDRVAKTLRIEHLLDRKTDRLSGGEMQRVSIGRAIVRKPRVFLMDEPLSALDAKLREALRTELKNLQMNLGATFLFVTHDQIEAMSMGDKIGVLNNGQLVQIGTPQEIYNDPVNTFVARAVGSPPMNLIDGTLVGRRRRGQPRASSCLSPTGTGQRDGRSPAHLRHPARGHLSWNSGAPAAAQVHDIENHGVEKILTLRAGDKVICRRPCRRRPMLAIEDAVRFSWNPEKVVLFGRAGEACGTRADLIGPKDASVSAVRQRQGQPRVSRCRDGALRGKTPAVVFYHFGIAQINGQVTLDDAQGFLPAAPVPMRIMLSSVSPAICGVMMTLSNAEIGMVERQRLRGRHRAPRRRCGHRAAPRSAPRHRSRRPRETLTRMARGFMRIRCARH